MGMDLWAGAPIPDGSRFDAIVVGAGAAGGVAAARLCEAGLKVAVFEAGLARPRPASPVTRSLTAVAHFLGRIDAERRLPPRLARSGERAFRLLGRVRQPVQSRCFAWAMAPDILVDDRDCPYETEQDSRFLWFRARQPGGRMFVPGHGRQYYRLVGMEREDGADGQVGWPFQLEELDQWYGWVEDKLGLRGSVSPAPGPHSSRLTEIMVPTQSERTIMDVIRARWPRAQPVLGSFAPPLQWLDLAAESGNLSCQAGAVVRHVLKDDNGAAEGIEWIDSRTGDIRTAHAPRVFLCASTIESTRILLSSRSGPGGSGRGTASSALGSYLMDHAVMSGVGFRAQMDGVLPIQSEPGRCIHIPPHASHDEATSLQIHVHDRPGGGARVDMVCFAEMLPDSWNRVSLSATRRDRHGIPIPVIRFRHSEEQHVTAHRQAEIIRQLASDLDLKDVTVNTRLSPGGTSVHECGTARMGTDPETSVVDQNNECWDIPGLYVTDGACFPRQHVHNPTLTIMALTARAAAHAAAQKSRSEDEDQPAPARFRAISAMSGVG